MWLKLQGKRHLVNLVHGTGKVRIIGLRPGTRSLIALYVGDARTTRARTTLPVAVKGVVPATRHR